jgi:hypothetical protein
MCRPPSTAIKEIRPDTSSEVSVVGEWNAAKLRISLNKQRVWRPPFVFI